MSLHIFTEPPMYASCYVIENGNNGILIDPCVLPETVFSYLGHSLKITHVLITHGHFDHIIYLDEWKAATNAEVLISSEDACMLSSAALNASSLFRVAHSPVCKTVPDILLYGDEELDLCGIKVKVFSAPGHTAGCLLYLTEDMLFSGDTLFDGSYGRYDLYSGDVELLIDTLRSMKQFLRKGLTLCPGHGDTCDFDRAYLSL